MKIEFILSEFRVLNALHCYPIDHTIIYLIVSLRIWRQSFLRSEKALASVKNG